MYAPWTSGWLSEPCDLNVALHDASAALGFAVEIHQSSDFLTGFFQQVSLAAREWDGRDIIHYLPG